MTLPMRQYELPRLDARSYRNPLSYADGIRRTNPDPFGFKHRGRYYCYSTDEHGVNVSRSDDLVTWEHHGHALQLPGRRNFWAPCVFYDDGTFHLYVSSVPEDSEDPHDERLMVAVSDDPLGPYQYVATFFDKFAIDPQVVRDIDGQLHMFYSTNDVTGLNSGDAGTSILVDRMVDAVTLAGEPRPVILPTLPEEVYAVDRFGDGRDWHTVEGATYLRHRDRAYLTYSGNAYVRENYFVGYGRATADASIHDLVWSKYPSDHDYHALIRRNDRVEGTGHNSIIVAPNLIDPWIMYHGREADEELIPGVEQRLLRIDPLFIDGDTLDTNAPSSEPQDAPALPDLRDAFDDARLGDDWVMLDGTWASGDRATTTSADQPRSLAVTALRFESYRAEVDLAAVLDHAGARVGIVPIYLDRNEFVEVLLDAGLASITARHVRGNVGVPLASASLPRFDLTKFHLVGVQRLFDRVTVQLDGIDVLTFRAPEGPASFGLTAHQTAARFSGFSLTHHLELWGESLALLPRIYAASRQVDVTLDGLPALGGELELVALDDRAGTVTTHDFELMSSARGRIRFSPAWLDERNHLLVEVDASGLRVIRVRDGEPDQLMHAPLAERRFSVRTTVMADQVAVHAAGRGLVVPMRTTRSSQRMTLLASRLRAYEATSFNPTPQREEG
ncbi:glycoside hydrolase family 43 protein [Agromyces albus]|uniref:glycoside hydrolase family 43 protein n=1 Tax=Agromyces albus TaxID=205332 RepID=UPI002786F7BC|nr:glycoside hydrolase family 43 protein [Agromyces albus]MDQ0574348.1 GH43 family beta-xylosidase [Agromyces albus]